MARYNKGKTGIEIGLIPSDRYDDVLGVISSLGYVIKAIKLKDFDTVL